MADDAPVAAPAEAVEQPERAAAAAGDKPADQSENVTTTEDKKTGKLPLPSAHCFRLEPRLSHPLELVFSPGAPRFLCDHSPLT